METLTPLLVAFVSNALVELAKRVQAIPVFSGETAKLRILLAVLVLAGNALSALLNGNFETFVASDQVTFLVNSGVSFLVAHLSYKIGIKPLSR